MTEPNGEEFYAVELRGYEPDFDWPRFRIVTPPTNGVLELANNPAQVFMGDPGTPALAPPPIPADSGGVRCVPRCLVTDDCQPGDPPCQDCTGARADTATCPEGQYWLQLVTYVPFAVNFAGTDGFTYAMLDAYGAEGPPAFATITLYER
ncbi:MAG: hypothetical protein QM692_06075 [Thermomicrobiales bacterium]